MTQATRTAEPRTPLLTRMRRGLPFVSVLLGLALATVVVVFVQKRYQQEARFRVQTVRLIGELRQLQVADVMNALALPANTPVLAVELPELSARIAALPWVSEVSLRRVMPGELRVSVREREPFLRFNDQALIDRNGQVFTPQNVSAFAHLPRVKTEPALVPLALEEYARCNATLKPLALAVQEMELSGRNALNLTLNNGLRVMFGRDDWQARLQRFVALYPGLTSRGQIPSYVDLRYDTGVAVAWPEAKTPNGKSNTQTAGL